MNPLQPIIRYCWPLMVLIPSVGLAAPLHSGYAMLRYVEVLASDLNQIVYRPQIEASTVYEGLHMIVQGTGYRWAAEVAADPALYQLYQQPYPEHHRHIGPAPLGQVLMSLAGSGWYLVVDPVNRLLSFERQERYRHD